MKNPASTMDLERSIVATLECNNQVIHPRVLHTERQANRLDDSLLRNGDRANQSGRGAIGDRPALTGDLNGLQGATRDIALIGLTVFVIVGRGACEQFLPVSHQILIAIRRKAQDCCQLSDLVGIKPAVLIQVPNRPRFIGRHVGVIGMLYQRSKIGA